MMANLGIPTTGMIEIRVIRDGKIDKDGPPDFRILAPQKEGYIIGRSDGGSSYAPDIDLLNLGAQDMGVSRRHSVLLHHQGIVQIMDLNSVNGTFLNGRRLSPHVPYVFKSGDKLTLANLEIIITPAE